MTDKETTFDDYLKEQLKDSEFRKEWENCVMKIYRKEMQKMRLIDADELKKKLQARHNNSEKDLDKGYDLGIATAINLIDNAPTVDLKDIYQEGHYDGHLEGYTKAINEVRPQGRWIPVNERLPEQANQSYLVTVDYGNGLVCSCQRFFFNEDIGWNDDCVIAWQPLPEPYQKGGEE